MGKFDRSGPPVLTTLSYSAGVQSHAILEMVLRGHLPLPAPFAVINANPGMENSESLRFVADARRRCQEAGIKFVTAEGPNLYEGLLNLKAGGKTRFDLPPLFVKREDGKEGRLAQRCTKQFKIQPMRRAVRRIRFENGYLPKRGPGEGCGGSCMTPVKDDVVKA